MADYNKGLLHGSEHRGKVLERRAVVQLRGVERNQQVAGGCTDSRLGKKHTVQNLKMWLQMQESDY